MTFWQEEKTAAPASKDKSDLAAAVMDASDSVPDPDRYLNYLLGLSEAALNERLQILNSQRAKDPYRNVARYSEFTRLRKPDCKAGAVSNQTTPALHYVKTA